MSPEAGYLATAAGILRDKGRIPRVNASAVAGLAGERQSLIVHSTPNICDFVAWGLSAFALYIHIEFIAPADSWELRCGQTPQKAHSLKSHSGSL